MADIDQTQARSVQRRGNLEIWLRKKAKRDKAAVSPGVVPGNVVKTERLDELRSQACGYTPQD